MSQNFIFPTLVGVPTKIFVPPRYEVVITMVGPDQFEVTVDGDAVSNGPFTQAQITELLRYLSDRDHTKTLGKLQYKCNVVPTPSGTKMKCKWIEV